VRSGSKKSENPLKYVTAEFMNKKPQWITTVHAVANLAPMLTICRTGLRRHATCKIETDASLTAIYI